MRMTMMEGSGFWMLVDEGLDGLHMMDEDVQCSLVHG